MNTIYLSTVTPVYRGARYLPDLVMAIDRVRRDLQSGEMPVELVEAIFVDDGAVDDSWKILEELQRAHSWIRVIRLSRNFGQHMATAAGILHASGDWIVTMDEDLQHDPRHIPDMLIRAVESGSDIVYASNSGQVHRSKFRDLTSAGIKRLAGWMAGEKAILRFKSFRMVRGSIARAASSVATHDTYLDVVFSWFTTCIESIELPMLDIRSAQGGRSGYRFTTLLRHGRRMLVSAGIRPLRAASALGVIMLAASTVLAVVIVILRLRHPELIQLQGWSSLVLLITFFGGLTSLLLGVALEYLSTVVLHILGKPTFFVVDRTRDTILREFLRRKAAE